MWIDKQTNLFITTTVDYTWNIKKKICYQIKIDQNFYN